MSGTESYNGCEHMWERRIALDRWVTGGMRTIRDQRKRPAKSHCRGNKHHMLCFGLVIWLILGPTFSGSSQPTAMADDLYDISVLDQVPLDPEVASSTVAGGVRVEQVSYVSEVWEGKPVRVAATFSYPEGKKNLPAIITPGGLPSRSQEFTDRGYALLGVQYRARVSWYTVKPSPKYSFFYHQTVALIRAISYLRTRPEVNPEAIGATGGSWAGMFTCYLAGVDPRLTAAVTFYGCGHIDEGWWAPGLNARPEEDRRIFLEVLDPGVYQPRIKSPILFMGGTNDFAFWLPVFIRSYLEVNSEKRLSLVPNGNHAVPAGMATDGLFSWFDLHLKREGQPFPTIESVKAQSEAGKMQVVIKASGPVPVTHGEVAFSQEAGGEWRSRLWETVPAKRQGDVWIAEIPVEDPGEPVVYLASVRDERNLTVSSIPQQADPRNLGVNKPTRAPDSRPALYAGSSPTVTWRGYGWLSEDATLEWVTDVRHGADASLRMEMKTAKGATVALDQPHAVVRWMHGRPIYRLSLWAKSDAENQPLWIGFQGGDWEDGQESRLSTEWQRLEFTCRIEGERRFSLVPAFKIPAGPVPRRIWITEVSVVISPE